MGYVAEKGHIYSMFKYAVILSEGDVVEKKQSEIKKFRDIEFSNTFSFN